MEIIAFNTKIPVYPCHWNIIPDKLPPAKIPKNWQLEYIPMADPRLFIFACFETIDGKLASRTLNATKYPNKQMLKLKKELYVKARTV